MFECPGCGANLKYDIASGKMSCEYCLRKYEIGSGITESRASACKGDAQSEKNMQEDLMEVTVFTCPQCGAELYSGTNAATACCIYCGSDSVLTRRLEGIRHPKRIIPFRKTKEQCQESIRAYLKNHLLAPRKLKTEAVLDHMRPVYVPYLDCTMGYEGELVALGKRRSVSFGMIETELYDVQTEVTATVSGFQFDGSSAFDDTLSEEITPFPSGETVSFRPEYLAGFYAEIPDVESYVYEEKAALAGREKLKEAVGKELKMEIEPEDKPLETFDAEHVLYPVWFTSLRLGDHMAYAVVNGVTGNVYCDVPVSLVKFFQLSLVLSVLIYGLFCLSGEFSMAGVLNIMGILTCIAGSLAAWLRALVIHREKGIDDRGHRSRRDELPYTEEPWTGLNKDARKDLDRKRKVRIEKWNSGTERKRTEKEVWRRRAGWIAGLLVAVLLIPVLITVVLITVVDIVPDGISLKWIPMALAGLAGVITAFRFHTYRTDLSGREFPFSRFGRTGVKGEQETVHVRFPGALWAVETALIFAAAYLIYLDPEEQIYYYLMAAVLFAAAMVSVVMAVQRYNMLFTRPVPFLKAEAQNTEKGRKKAYCLRSFLPAILPAAVFAVLPAVCLNGKSAHFLNYAGMAMLAMAASGVVVFFLILFLENFRGRSKDMIMKDINVSCKLDNTAVEQAGWNCRMAWDEDEIKKYDRHSDYS